MYFPQEVIETSVDMETPEVIEQEDNIQIFEYTSQINPEMLQQIMDNNVSEISKIFQQL